MDIMENGWNLSNNQTNRAKRMGSKLKSLRRILR
jgi:hypothetical protein